MIPKIIHYIWLGGNPLPEIANKCIASWQKFCPDYEIRRHDETNLNLDKYQFARDAYDAKKFAFASDVLRTDVLYNEGGIYFDVDVELIKPIDDLLEGKSAVTGFESSCVLAPGLIMATKKHNPDMLAILETYKNATFNINDMTANTICEVFMAHYEKKGLVRENKTQTIEGTTFYSSEYFSPIDVITNRKKITENTRSIHWYSASWYTPKQKALLRIKKIANFLTFGLAGKIYNKIKK
ncbi:MAG: glycosyl transferase [Clostridia bacterium]|nr:glycosyl transferase [Clostridia bacterium]